MASARRGLTPAAAAPPLGALDRVEPDGTIAGWCVSPAAPAAHRTVAITVDGHVVARAPCNRARPDLPGQGAHGFLLRLPPKAMTRGAEVEVAARDVASGQLVGFARRVVWGGGPAPAAPVAPVAPVAPQGNLDRVTRDGWVAGWCWDPAHPSRRVAVEILVDEEVVGSTLAATWRPDLQPAGVGDGGHGFSFALPYELLARKGTPRVRVREAGSGWPLGEAVTLRIGLLAEGEQRMLELEREVRQLRARLDDFSRDAAARPAIDERATRALFETVARFFAELAEGRAEESRGFGLGQGFRTTVEDFRARLPPLSLRRAPDAAETLVIVPATAPIEAVHRCLRALHAASVDAAAELLVLDTGGADPACALLPGLVPGLRYQHCERAGVVAAARAVLAETTCRTVAFVDPWVDVTPRWLADTLDTLAREHRATAVGGPVLAVDGLVRHGGLRMAPGGMLADPDQFAEADLPEQRALRPVEALGPFALVLDRAAVVRAGNLDPAFHDLSHATVALCARLREAGGAVLLQPSAAVRWAGDPAADVSPTVPDLSAPTEDARKLRLLVLETAAPGPLLGQALFIDDAVPRPDRDAGSVVAVEHMLALRRLGWQVTFAPARGAPSELADRRRLERLGIAIAEPPHHPSILHFLRARGAELGLVWITRHGNAAPLGPAVRELAPAARLVFAPADLHFLRETREAELGGRKRGTSVASRETRARELACARAADATVVLSDHELSLLAAETDPARLHLLPWIARPAPPGPGFLARDGVLFVGGFGHRPNADAVLWYARRILPLVRRARPGLVLHVVGAEPPPEILALAAADVMIHGWVADLPALLARVRLTIAPLRYGAGFKGKVATSLAHGVPVVLTTIALEGTGLADGDGVVLADDPAAFAAAIFRAHDDPAAWQALSARAVERVAALYAPEQAEAVLRRLLAGLVPPAPALTPPV